jgi:hypothetical protein
MIRISFERVFGMMARIDPKILEGGGRPGHIGVYRGCASGLGELGATGLLEQRGCGY